MEKAKNILWAPWRINYIRQTRSTKGCLLCKIAKSKNHDLKNLVFLRTKTAYCLLNRFPYNNGHIMICPVAHKQSLGQLTKNEILGLMNLVIKTEKLLQKVLSPQGYNLGINFGRAAGAGIDKHLHIHIVPRWNGDTNFMPVVSRTKVISQSLNELLRQLKKEASRCPMMI